MARDVGDYRIEELLGYGGCGEVWRARHRGNGESVALKWLRGGGAAQRERQLREAGLLAALDHPHLGRLREVVTDRGEPVLVLEHYAGGSLAGLLARRRRLTSGELVSVLAPVAAALAYAHDEGVVHADLTPSNVLFTAAGRPVLTDLGLARVLGSGDDLHATPEYVDPLVAQGGPPTEASDVFGLGAVAFHALTGIPPWNAAGAEATLAVAAAGRLPDLRQLAPGLPGEVYDVVERATSLRPELRGSAAEFALDLRHACEPAVVAFATDARGRPLPPTRTGPVTQAVRRTPIGSSGPAGRDRLLGPAHGGPPSGPRRGRRRLRPPGRALAVPARTALFAAAAAAALAAAVLLGVRWGDGTGTSPASALRPVAAAPTDSVDEYAVPPRPAGWLPVLRVLYERRAGAFEQADADALAEVYTAASAQAAADRREIVRLRADGLHTDGFVPEVIDVLSAEWAAPTVTLVVRDRFGPYAVVDERRVVTSYAGRDTTDVQVRLRLTDDGWRIDSALRLAPSG